MSTVALYTSMMYLAIFIMLLATYTIAKAGTVDENDYEHRHPMLYFGPSDIDRLRSSAGTTHAKVAKTIQTAGQKLVDRPNDYLPPVDYKQFAKNWNEHFGNRLCVFSLYCLLYPDDQKALGIVKTYMDRMASYADWYVADSRGVDQVPVGHSLTGFATAYDFLHRYLEPDRRDLYLAMIRNVTSHMYDVLTTKRDWPFQYIHNHAPSNLVATLLGSLVVSVNEPKTAAPWLERTRIHMDKAMQILSLITDGSMDEGVAYGTYTSRGVTQYVYLAKRHFHVDHTGNPWLEQYFWSLYHTVLPGFHKAVGIADSNPNWFYGPESQLVFLDNFVLKNGHGNWLADKIRNARKPLPKQGAQTWSTVHTEFIFYNASLPPREPPGDRSKMHVFPDWGVVTYGGGNELAPGNTFLSFKSGALNGEAVHEIMSEGIFSGFVNGWKNFNPGHEHPDQNSFIFVPNGKEFVTESYYGAKFSYLDNVVLFAPSANSDHCNQPWEGQLGECEKWLKYKEYSKETAGNVITAASEEGMVFIAGESASVYSKGLGLSSVYRAVLLLRPEVLLVFDTIRLAPGSTTKVASALFHNVAKPFRLQRIYDYDGAFVEHDDGKYSMFSMAHGSTWSNTSIANGVRPPSLREGATNHVNVTFALNEKVTNVVHVFFGPHSQIGSVALLPSTGPNGVRINIEINGVEYKVSVATLIRSTGNAAVPWKERKKITGCGVYAKVETPSKQHVFGAKKRHQSILRRYFPISDTRKGFAETGRVAITEHVESSRRLFQRITVMIDVLFLISLLLLMYIMKQKSPGLARGAGANGRLTAAAVILSLVLLLLNSVCLDSNGENACLHRRSRKDISLSKATPAANKESPAMRHPTAATNSEPPFVVIASMPGFGSELLGNLFNESSDFLYLDIPDRDLAVPCHGIDSGYPDLCPWKNIENEFNSATLGWFHTLKTRPSLLLNNLLENDQVGWNKRHMRSNRNTGIALNLRSGFWTSKIQWIRDVVGEDSFHSIVVVRDPRSWIFAILEEGKKSRTLNSLITAFEDLGNKCNSAHEDLQKFKSLKNVESKRSVSTTNNVEDLASVWTISTALALSQGVSQGNTDSTQVVRVEDVIRNPRQEATDIFGHIGVPLSLKRLSRLERRVKSGYFSLPYFGKLDATTLNRWKSGLTLADVGRIERITGPLMKELGYDLVSE